MHFTIPLCDLQEFSMEYKDPMFELLSSLEQIVFKDETRKITLTQKPNPFTEFEQLRRGTGLKTDEFARALGVTVGGSGMGIETRKTHASRAQIDAPDTGKPTLK